MSQPNSPVKETNVLIRNIDPNTGKKVINQYVILKELGRGVHGKVKLCQHIDSQNLYAMKIVQRRNKRKFTGLNKTNKQQNEEEEKIKREIAIMKKCQHPNIVTLFEVIDDPSLNKIYLIMEYVDGGELIWKNDFEEPVISIMDAKRILLDIILGLDYLHYQGIVHRDIKPQNILLTQQKQAKIADFGVSFFSKHLQLSVSPYEQQQHPHQQENDCLLQVEMELAKTAGSPAFFAPELCSEELIDFLDNLQKNSFKSKSILNVSEEEAEVDRESIRSKISALMEGTFEIEHVRKASESGKKPQIGKPIDIWALGVTLYCMIFGRLPFQAQNEFELFSQIPRQTIPFPFAEYRPNDFPTEESFNELKDLFDQVFNRDPVKRISLYEMKRHIWLREVVPGQTEEEKLKYLEETDAINYCKNISFGEQSGKIEVTKEEVEKAVTAKAVIKKWMQDVKRRFSKSFLNIYNSERKNSTSKTVSQSSFSSLSNSPEPQPPVAVRKKSFGFLRRFSSQSTTFTNDSFNSSFADQPSQSSSFLFSAPAAQSNGKAPVMKRPSLQQLSVSGSSQSSLTNSTHFATTSVIISPTTPQHLMQLQKSNPNLEEPVSPSHKPKIHPSVFSRLRITKRNENGVEDVSPQPPEENKNNL